MANTVVYLPETILPGAHLAAAQAYYLDAEGMQSAALGAVLKAKAGGKVQLVLSVSNATLTKVELNRKQARHLEKVLPFMLEEDLLETPKSLWFSHSKGKQTQHYPVVVCKKTILTDLLEFFAVAEVQLQGVWVDAQLLSSMAPAQIAFEHSILLLPSAHNGLRVAEENRAGMLAALGLTELPEAEPLSAVHLERLGQNIQQSLGINLLHSDFAPQATSIGQKLWHHWRPVVYFSAAIVALLCVFTVLQTRAYLQAAAATQQQSAQLYQQYFPGSQPPQLLQRQFETQLRRLQQSQQSASKFMQLMYPVGEGFSSNGFAALTPQRIQFDERDGHLSLDVNAPEFALVERFSDTLSKEGIAVSIGNSRTESGRVRARLRVE